MQHDIPMLIILAIIYGTAAWLILYQIEIRVRFYARTKCRFGYHKRISKESGKTIKHYRCINCGKPKDHPHLQIIDGGKKDLGVKFRF